MTTWMEREKQREARLENNRSGNPTCENCSKPYKSRSASQAYCSENCREIAKAIRHHSPKRSLTELSVLDRVLLLESRHWYHPCKGVWLEYPGPIYYRHVPFETFLDWLRGDAEGWRRTPGLDLNLLHNFIRTVEKYGKHYSPEDLRQIDQAILYVQKIWGEDCWPKLCEARQRADVLSKTNAERAAA
jgi:hypothetical protein